MLPYDDLAFHEGNVPDAPVLAEYVLSACISPPMYLPMYLPVYLPIYLRCISEVPDAPILVWIERRLSLRFFDAMY